MFGVNRKIHSKLTKTLDTQYDWRLKSQRPLADFMDGASPYWTECPSSDSAVAKSCHKNVHWIGFTWF
jgi:hypothetical protein